MKLFFKNRDSNNNNQIGKDLNNNAICFNFSCLPKEYKKEDIYLYKWIVHDGDWVNEGESLFIVQVGEKSITGYIAKSQPIKSQLSGFLEILLEEGHSVKKGQFLYKAHHTGNYQFENSKFKSQFHYLFNGYKLKDFQDDYKHRLRIHQWLYLDGDYVKENEVIVVFEHAEFEFRNNEKYYHQAEKTGFLEIKKQSNLIDLKHNEHIYSINENQILKPVIINQENNLQSKSEECYVYLMIDTTNNFYKIGISNKPGYRERTLQSDKPTIELVIAKKFPSRLIAESIEKALHNSFDNRRLRGEWFVLNEQEVHEIKETLK